MQNTVVTTSSYLLYRIFCTVFYVPYFPYRIFCTLARLKSLKNGGVLGGVPARSESLKNGGVLGGVRARSESLKMVVSWPVRNL